MSLPETVRRQYDFQPQFFRLGAHQLHYLDEGQGAPLLMLHGNPSWSFLYRDLIRSLRPNYRILAPDHIGCGLSDKPLSSQYSYRFQERVRDIEMLVDNLGIQDDLTLVLHDWGGAIGMAYATQHPGRIKRIILFNTAAFLLPDGKHLHWSIRLCRRSSIAAVLIRSLNLFALTACHLGCRKTPMPKAVKAGYLAPYDSWRNRIAHVKFVQDIPLEPQHPSYPLLEATERGLSQLKEIPILICWGERDFVFDKNFLEEWCRRFPEAEVHRFAPAGHYVLEDEKEAILPIVQDFLRRTEEDRISAR